MNEVASPANRIHLNFAEFSLLQVRVRLYCSQQVLSECIPILGLRLPAAGGEEPMGSVLSDVSLTERVLLYGALLAQRGARGWPHAFYRYEIWKISLCPILKQVNPHTYMHGLYNIYGF